MSTQGPRAPKGWRRLRFGEVIKKGDKVARYNEPRWIKSDSVGSRYQPHTEAGGEEDYGQHVHIRKRT